MELLGGCFEIWVYGGTICRGADDDESLGSSVLRHVVENYILSKWELP